MQKTYRIQVFGKPACDKCTQLNRRIDKLLRQEDWQDFDKEYFDLSTIPGLVEFADAECLNPQRVPAMRVVRSDGEGGYLPLPNPSPVIRDEVCGKSKLYSYIGLQTDYSPEGRGLLSPAMIQAVLEDARQA